MTELPRPNAVINWGQTWACMRCYCVCGEQCHIDGTCAYAVKCSACGRTYEMEEVIGMRQVDSTTWAQTVPLEAKGPHVRGPR